MIRLHVASVLVAVLLFLMIGQVSNFVNLQSMTEDVLPSTISNLAFAQTPSPPPPVISSPITGTTTSIRTLTISGTAEPSNFIHIFVDGNEIGSAVADGTGSWSFTPSELTDGSHTISATATNQYTGITSPSTAITIIVDTVAPNITISSPSNGVILNTAGVAVSGIASDTGSGVNKIEVNVDGGAFALATGTTSWTLTTSFLSCGSHTIYAKATDNAGNTSPSSFIELVGWQCPQVGRVAPDTSSGSGGPLPPAPSPPPPPPPPECGGLSFSLATSLLSGSCAKHSGKHYSTVTMDDQTYYVVVQLTESYVWKYSCYGNKCPAYNPSYKEYKYYPEGGYSISLSGNTVTLRSQLQYDNYDLYIYDSNKNQIGSSTGSYGVTEAVEIVASAPTPRPAPTPIPTPSLPSGYAEKTSYSDDCRYRPSGTVCIAFSDGYVWLVSDSIRSWDKKYEDGRDIQVAVGFNALYYHILNTNLVKMAPLVTQQPTPTPKPIPTPTIPTPTIPTPTPSYSGVLSLNSNQFSVSKYKPAEVVVTGKVIDYKKGTPVLLTIIKPDGTVEQQKTLVGSDGKFKALLKLDHNSSTGRYAISAQYGSQVFESASFLVERESDKKPSPIPAPSEELEGDQLQLNIKTVLKKNTVTLTVENPEDSVYDVYVIKFTVDGKVIKYAKAKGWTAQRISSDSIMYTVKGDPLEPEEKMQIKIIIQSKKREIKWEAFSEDQESLGSGKIMIK